MLHSGPPAAFEIIPFSFWLIHSLVFYSYHRFPEQREASWKSDPKRPRYPQMLRSVGLGCLRLTVHPTACGRQSSEVPYHQQKRREEMGKKPKTKPNKNPKQRRERSRERGKGNKIRLDREKEKGRKTKLNWYWKEGQKGKKVRRGRPEKEGKRTTQMN